MPKGGKVSHYLPYIGIYRYIKWDVNHEKDNADRLWGITWSWAGAKAVARELAAVYLRVDTIEQALRFSKMLQAEVGPAGYLVTYRLAEENLRIGRTVVADSVNPLNMTRDAWLSVAVDALTDAIEIEVISSDPSEHRRRVETCNSDIDGLSPPSWEAVLERTYEDWICPHLVFDTANRSLEEAKKISSPL